MPSNVIYKSLLFIRCYSITVIGEYFDTASSIFIKKKLIEIAQFQIW